MRYWTSDYEGNAFILFGLPHLITLLLVVAALLTLTIFRQALRGQLEDRFRYTFAGVLIINELSWHVWNASFDQWVIQTMLPLHLCGIMVWVSAVLLLSKNYRVFEFVYFLGIGGAIQALITPNIGDYGYPHFRFFQSMISHTFIVIAGIYAVVIWNYRPTFLSCKRAFFWANAFMALVFFLNFALDSNYMFLAGKPDGPSLLDHLGPWPFYIIGIEVFGLITIGILYLPIYLMNRSKTQIGVTELH